MLLSAAPTFFFVDDDDEDEEEAGRDFEFENDEVPKGAEEGVRVRPAVA